MVLQGPDRQEYDVHLWCSINKLTFGQGWQEFVNYHDLQEGDFLVFKYISKLCFMVKIFDRTGCEKNHRTKGNPPLMVRESAHNLFKFVSSITMEL